MTNQDAELDDLINELCEEILITEETAYEVIKSAWLARVAGDAARQAEKRAVENKHLRRAYAAVQVRETAALSRVDALEAELARRCSKLDCEHCNRTEWE